MKRIYIERKNNLLKIVITDRGNILECFIEKINMVLKGDIYKGVIKNIIPSINCAFIDIGTDKNAYMYINKKPNNQIFKKGQEIMVEVLKEGTESKGPKISTVITLPGKYIVLDSLRKGITFSAKITDNDFIKEAKLKLTYPEKLGFIVRTEANNADLEVIQKEIYYESKIYSEILRKFNYCIKPQLLYSNGGILGRVFRDYVNNTIEEIIVDTLEDYNFFEQNFKIYEHINTKITLHKSDISLFVDKRIESKVQQLLNRRVELKCGGYLIFDRTEAMHVIDVNSGSNVNSINMKDTIFTTNMQAAEEISRQIRLRNLSGIIVVDFIDITVEKHKREILNKLKEGFLKDKNKTVVYDFTELNIVQIARRKSGLSIYDYLLQKCNFCSGTGCVMNYNYLLMYLKDELNKLSEAINLEHVYIIIPIVYEKNISKNISEFIGAIKGKNKKIYLTYTNHNNIEIKPLYFNEDIIKLQKFKING